MAESLGKILAVGLKTFLMYLSRITLVFIEVVIWTTVLDNIRLVCPVNCLFSRPQSHWTTLSRTNTVGTPCLG